MSLRDQHGPFFGEFGGRYMPESLIAAIDELTAVYETAMGDPAFAAELEALLHSYAGRPSALTEVPRFAEHAGGVAFEKEPTAVAQLGADPDSAAYPAPTRHRDWPVVPGTGYRAFVRD